MTPHVPVTGRRSSSAPEAACVQGPGRHRFRMLSGFGYPALLFLAGFAVGAPVAAPAGSGERPLATVADAIEMVRIQYDAAADGSVAAISPDGSQAAFVTWRGDLQRNLNLYELRLVDLRAPLKRQPPKIVLTRRFAGDSEDQGASPIKQLRFVQDGRALAFLGRDADGVAQAYLLDLASGQERQLTRHPTAVRGFEVGPDGTLLAYSAVTTEGDEARRRLDEDGVFLWDASVLPDNRYRRYLRALAVSFRTEGGGFRQYFLAGDEPRLFFDSRRSRPDPAREADDPGAANSPSMSLVDDGVLGFGSLSADPEGRRLLLYPYQVTEQPLHPERYAYYRDGRMNAYARRVAPQVAMVDRDSGEIRPLLGAPSPQFEYGESGSPFWSKDGRAVILYTLFPERPADPPAWAEFNPDSGRVVPLGLGPKRRPVGWTGDGHALLVEGEAGQFLLARRGSDGGWQPPEPVGRAEGFNSDWRVASNGRIVLGVRDGLRQAPELAAFDLASGRVDVLTDLNPQLRERRLGEVQPYHWRGAPDGPADGFLVKPVDYRPGRRYPLVILLDDGTLGRRGEPYFLDAAWQLNGHAVQMLAGEGFMVLYHRDPPMGDAMETPDEPRRFREDVERAVAQLDREGLIDPARVGVSGWSRAGYHTNSLVIHSSIPFAAATINDGGGVEYNEGMRPFSDEELARISTPLLLQPHGPLTLSLLAPMADRMTALGKPVEVLYFHSASHSTTRPQHRWRSLQTHVDWWKFWLQDRIDPSPAKREQYEQWRTLRRMQATGAG